MRKLFQRLFLATVGVTLGLTEASINSVQASDWFQAQVSATRNQKYDTCLFGDSISKSLGSTLGKNTFNFALGGMTTTSLVEQLSVLTRANVRCQRVIIAMGTNDAQNNIDNDTLVENLKDSIFFAQAMGANKVFLIPAFYSTVKASRNPSLAGPIARVERVNAFIRQVAALENVELFEKDVQLLYQGQSLKRDLTTDGVHLNAEGQNIYRQAILKILRGEQSAQSTNK